MGCPEFKMLNFIDGDLNKPLHAAVQFSNLGAVKLCLEHGSSIGELTEKDNSTAVHIASAQGSLEILNLMYEKQTELFLELLHATDVNEMTPLHKAAMFDQVECARFLLEKGAFVDDVDHERRTPLLLAASRNCIEMVYFLLEFGASISLKDSKERNFLHLIMHSQLNESNRKTDTNIYNTLNGFKCVFEILQKVI